jgi:catechol 2,3-dioxygenase-like lactoylglutathione lyase family enzyme
MIDHTGAVVSDFNKSKAFYSAALAPIGYKLMLEFPASVTGHTNVAGFGEPPKPDFWISRGTPNKPPVHVAFQGARQSLGRRLL